MTVCIAEKPSVGRDIAKVLGANTRRDGYLEGNGWQVTWVFGHLCQLYEPHEYQEQWRRWSMDLLPMIPDRFRIRVTNDEGVQKQFAIIKELCSKADAVVNCGDAGQEGELIQRWVQQQAGVKCPIHRLWISSLTEESIREGFQNLKPQSEYDKLYHAGLMRAIGDWLLGMNASRAYTLRYGAYKQTLSVGRVQTPTLALMAARQREIENFVPRTYWELKTVYRETVFSAIMAKDEEEESQDTEAKNSVGTQAAHLQPTENETFKPLPPIQSAAEGEALVARLKDKPLTILDVQKKPGKEYAPRLFDLTSLQVECNKKYGFTAEKTLNLIQSLYEKKVTTYPRVDTTYLSDDIYPKVHGTLQGIRNHYDKLIDPLLSQPGLPKSKRVFDNSKVTDHHAIIPTGMAPNALSADEQKVYDLVARRFIAAFYPECKISTTTVLAHVEDVGFKVSGKQIIEPGWRVVFDKQKDLDDEKPEEREKTLPAFTKGESGPHDPQLAEKQTTPPKPYTEATLLRAMETAGKTVDDEELRAMMKENGIGRPSTRAAIIETLFKRQYIIRSNKSLTVTALGFKLIDSIQTELLKSAELTGLWEKKLRQIEAGQYEPAQFMEELKTLVLEVITDLRYVGLGCPLCRQGTVIKGKHAYGCTNWRNGCQYRVPFPWEK